MNNTLPTFEIDEKDFNPETKVIFLVLTIPGLFAQCQLTPDDFETWSGQWQIIQDKVNTGEEINMFRAVYPENFQLSRFMLDNTYISENDFELFCSQIRDKRILNDIKHADSLDDIQNKLDEQITKITIPTINDSLNNVFDDYCERRERRKDGYVCLKSGHRWIDTVVQLDKGQLVTIAARPGNGKSSMALTLGIDLAHHRNKVLYFALEMSEQEMIYRSLSQTNNEPLSNIYNASKENIVPLMKKFKEYTNGFLDVVSPQTITTGTIKKLSKNYDVVVVDQLSNLADIPQRGELKTSLYSRMCYALKSQSIINDQLIIMCCQINRQGTETPLLSNLKDSGAIEEASDKVIILHNDDGFGLSTKVIAAKNRQGQSGVQCEYEFKRHFTKFVQPV